MTLPAISTPSRTSVWRRGIAVGRIGGIRIVVAPSWFVTAALIVVLAVPVVRRVTGGGTAASIAVSIALAVLLGVSVLAHELGHCAVAALFRIRVTEVRLYLVGGYSELSRPPRSAKEESLVAAAGPVVSALVALICWALLAVPDTYSVGWLIALELALANGIVAVFNILPALPLDGGRVLRAGFWQVGRSPRAGTIAGVVGGYVIAAALLVWAALVLARPDRTGVLLAVIIATMAFFVAAGAGAEWPRRVSLPSGMTLSSLMRPVRTAAASRAPATSGLIRPAGPESAASGAVRETASEPAAAVLVVAGADGRTLGIVDPLSRLGPRADHSAQSPQDTSYPDLVPLEPEMIIRPGTLPGAVVEHMIELSLPYVAIAGADGRIEGVVLRVDVERVLTSRRLARRGE